jgi:hypothetical protein
MPPRFAPRLALGLVLLAALACGSLPNVGLPNIPIVTTLQAAATSVGTLEAAATALATVSSSVMKSEATFAAATPVPTAVVPDEQLLPARLKANQLKLQGNTIDSNGSDFFGPIMSVQVTNPSTKAVVTTIPCGLIFVPDDGSYQRLMVLQAVSATVTSTGPAELKPFVACIDDGKHAPANAATYQIGTMATGDLLKLAACVCGQPLGVNQDLNQEFGLQVALWHTTDAKFPSEITQSPLGPALQPLMPLFLSSANGWLTKCGLKVIS